MKWMEELRASAEPECVIYLVGNQVDRVEINPALRQVPYEQAKTFADKNRLFFEETSALTNARVTDVFENLLNRNLNKIIINLEIYSVRSEIENNEGDLLDAEGKKFKRLADYSPPDELKPCFC